LRTLITELQQWKTDTQIELTKTRNAAFLARNTLNQLDIPQILDNIETCKTKCVRHTELEALHEHLASTASTLAQTTDGRFNSLEQANWATKVELKEHANEIDTLIDDKINIQLDTRLHTTNLRLTDLNDRIDQDMSRIDTIENKREAVIDNLNNAFEVPRDTLATEVREYTMDKLQYDLSQDATLQAKLQSIIRNSSKASELQLALDTILDDQLAAIKIHMQAEIEPILNAIVDKGITKIDTVIRGTTDQAVKDVRRRARNLAPPVPPTDPTVQTTQRQTSPVQNTQRYTPPVPEANRIPTVTPPKIPWPHRQHCRAPSSATTRESISLPAICQRTLQTSFLQRRLWPSESSLAHTRRRPSR
jgi:hypothetical protein